MSGLFLFKKKWKLFLFTLVVSVIAANQWSAAEVSDIEVERRIEKAVKKAVDNKDLFYEEAIDQYGRVRPYYRDVLRIYFKMTQKEKADFLRNSFKDFKGDNKLDPLPRLISKHDYNSVQKGAEQRAEALRHFLMDHYSGKKQYRSFLPEETVNEMIRRNGASGFEGLVDPRSISFIYGPDIIRDAEGTWRVVEDNIGFVGGMGDLQLARDSLLKNQPQYKDILEIPDPMDFYREIAKRYKARATPNDGALVIFGSPPYADNEDKRIKKIMEEFGFDFVTPYTKKKLVMKDGKAFLEWTTASGRKTRKPVGFVWFNGEHHWVDPSHPATRDQFRLWTASEHLGDPNQSRKARQMLKKAIETSDPKLAEEAITKHSVMADELPLYLKGAPKGIVEGILSGRVRSNYLPGLDFANDKGFYYYVEDLIRFYLHQEPIIKNIPTQRFEKADGKVDKALLDEVFKNLDQYVIKTVGGRGGDGVWVGPKVTKKSLKGLKQRIISDPGNFIVQKYTHLSVLG